MIPTGEQTVLRHKEFRAVVTEVGASLRTLSWRGRPLLAGFAEDALPLGYQGAVLAPWPNRIADGRYAFGGRTHQLALSEPDRGNALHGLVTTAAWRAERLEAGTVRLRHRLWPQPGYPFLLDLQVLYRLTDGGLSCTLTATNAGDVPAPYGGSFHPYLVAGEGDVDGWTLQVPAGSYLTVDPDRLLPRGIAPCDGLNFRRPTSLRGIEVDHAFTDIAFDASGSAMVTLTDRPGRGVYLAWDNGCRWLQLCIPGAQRPELQRRALAVEPMSCPPDAFNSGIDLVTLLPGDSHAIELTIGPIG